MQQQNEGDEKKESIMQIIPTTQHILDNYDILSILEKNQLWKLVLKKVTYTVHRTMNFRFTFIRICLNWNPINALARLHKTYIFTEIH